MEWLQKQICGAPIKHLYVCDIDRTPLPTFNPSSIVNKVPAERSQSRLTGIWGVSPTPPHPPTSSDDSLTTKGEDNMELF